MRRRIALIAVGAGLAAMAMAGGAAGGILFAFVRDLPSLEPLEQYQPSVATILYSDAAEPFASFFEQRRILVPLPRIPRHLRDAVLAVEDARFYRHRGLDPRRILSALLADLRAGRRVQGGSTITQQLARVLFLTPDKTFARKVKEALLALEIERRYPKDKILEMYLNQIYFGHGAYGVEAAAQTYFRKSVGDLTLAEAAMLAGLPSNPTHYSPLLDPERARRRRDHVLARMVRQGAITPAQGEAAGRAPLDPGLFARSANVAPYFVEHVRQYLEEKYGTYPLYNGGLRVYTTLNLRLQRAAEEALAKGLRDIDKARGYRGPHRSPGPWAGGRPTYLIPRPGEILQGQVVKVQAKSLLVRVGRYQGEIPFDRLGWAKLPRPAEAFNPGDGLKVQVLAVDERRRTLDLALEQDPDLEGAFVALDPRDGQIKAMAGGFDFERSKFNRAVQAKRQPGSAFKPFVYATAFDLGLTPSTIIEDSPITFRFTANGQRVEWSPENYDRKYHGPTTLRRGLEQSVNVLAVKLIQQVGVKPVIELAQRLGIESDLREEIALALGVSELTPLELVSAYGVIANGGVRAEPFAVRKVLDSRGRTLEEHFPEPQWAIRAETAYVLTNVMKGVVERGTAARARALGRPLAGKTGTTSEYTDAWFIGFTPSLVAGAWVGYDTKKSLGPGETGSRVALPIWMAFMEKALAGTSAEDFPIPEDVVAIPVNHQTGRPAPPGEKGVITEYFIKGTEPHPLEASRPIPAASVPAAAAAHPPEAAPAIGRSR